MRWLHLSDIHFNPRGVDGTETSLIRNGLLKYLNEQNIKVDEIFLTGDYRFAKICANLDEIKTYELAKDVANYIKEIAVTVGIPKDEIENRIHLVPGNHDINRKNLRGYLIDGMKKDYKVNEGRFEKEALEQSVEGQVFFFKVYSEIFGEEKKNHDEQKMKENPHRYEIYEKYSLLNLNTTLCCGTDEDEGALYVGSGYLADSLSKIRELNPFQPIIVLGHHGLRMLNFEERKKIISIFRQYDVNLYLCGHEHEVWYEYILENSLQINMGCLKFEDKAQASFSVGEYFADKNMFNIEAHLWDENWGWNKYTHFRNNNDGLSLWVNPPFSKMEYFNTLNEMFSDVEEYISLCKGNLRNQDIIGYGLDLQVAASTIQHIIKTYPGEYSFRVLVYNKELINGEGGARNPFDSQELDNSIRSINKFVKDYSRISIRETKYPYSFFGLKIDDYLYFTWLRVDNNRNVISNKYPYYKIKTDGNEMQEAYITSFTSWFEYYWTKGEEVLE